MKELMSKLKELPLDKRVEAISKILPRLAIRAKKTTTGLVSPQTVMVHKEGEDIQGPIFKGMLFKGSLTKAIIIFSERPKSPINIEVKILNGDAGESKVFYASKAKSMIDLGIDTEDGSAISISIHPVKEDYKVTEVWLSMLWTPSVSNTEAKQYLIDELIGGIDNEIN
jgi:hypothetical protein